MAELGWKDAIIWILEKSEEPMHYTEIADAIAGAGLKTKVGATPKASIAATISMSLKNDGESSPFAKVARGYFTLKGKPSEVTVEEEEAEAGFLNALGMYWKRDNVVWKNNPKLMGSQQSGSIAVDFGNQKGVYMLHDGSKVVYVGRTTDQKLGTRLKQHTIDRLNGRWDRFSWFGIFGVSDDGKLKEETSDTFNVDNLIATMEALLIEGLEPPQNRKRGDDFSAVEFLQVPDPEIKKNQMKQLMETLQEKLSEG